MNPAGSFPNQDHLITIVTFQASEIPVIIKRYQPEGQYMRFGIYQFDDRWLVHHPAIYFIAMNNDANMDKMLWPNANDRFSPGPLIGLKRRHGLFEGNGIADMSAQPAFAKPLHHFT